MFVDYDRWAHTYDATRGVSPSVLGPLLDALGPPRGRSLLDVGGGTGNFALALRSAGFVVTLCDISPEMVRRADAKLSASAHPVARGNSLGREPVEGAPTFLVADAQRLPFHDAAFDCAVSINVLGHVPDWRAFFREARRALRDGPFLVKGSTLETLQASWVTHYLPGIAARAADHQFQPEAAIINALRDARFRRVQLRRVHYRDLADGSIQALKHDPEAFLDDKRIMNTATLQRLPPDERRNGLDAIRRDLRSGVLREVIARYKPLNREYGDGSLFVAWP